MRVRGIVNRAAPSRAMKALCTPRTNTCATLTATPFTPTPFENYFSVFKRGMKGVYQHCSEKHLHRYLAEFDFRYSNRIRLGVDDVQRTERAIKGIVGKRLMYR